MGLQGFQIYTPWISDEKVGVGRPESFFGGPLAGKAEKDADQYLIISTNTSLRFTKQPVKK